MKRRSLTWVLSAAVAGGLGFALRASAQPAAGVPRIGVLRWGAAGDDAQLDLRAALAALGYREGETLLVEWRFARTGDQGGTLGYAGCAAAVGGPHPASTGPWRWRRVPLARKPAHYSGVDGARRHPTRSSP